MFIQNKNKILIKEVMMSLDQMPIAKDDIILKEALEIMDEFRLGIICVIDQNSKLKGVITDGDIRRTLLKVQKPLASILVGDLKQYCILDPIAILEDNTLLDGINLMGQKQIWDLPVIDKNNSLVGLLHLHSAISAILKG